MRRTTVLATTVLLTWAAAPVVARDRVVICTLTVKGHNYLHGPCLFSPSQDGSFSIGTGAKRRTAYFAYVNKNEDGSAEAYWNEDPEETHAHSSLGTVRQHGACWTNDQTSICAE